MPVWHASIAIIRNQKLPKKVIAWNKDEKAAAWDICMDLLKDVGTGRFYHKEGDVALHLRRMLSEGELTMINKEWLAIPAVDMS